MMDVRNLLASGSWPLADAQSFPKWIVDWFRTESNDVSIESSWALPTWLTLLVVAISIMVVVAMYWPQRGVLRSNPATQRNATRITLLLATLRSLAVGLTLWMLATWVLQPYETDRPMLALLVDRSASMSVEESGLGKSKTSQSRLEQVRQALSAKSSRSLDQLGKKFRTTTYSVGEKLTELTKDKQGNAGQSKPANVLDGLEADENVSRLGDGIRDLLALGRGQSLSGIVVFTDGVTTQGLSLTDAASLARRQLVPLYFVEVGKPQTRADLALSDLIAPQLVFQGDTITLKATLSRHDIQESSHKLRLIDIESGEVLNEAQVNFSGEQREQVVQLSFVSPAVGIRSIRIEAQPVEGEVDVNNNQIVHTVEVRDTAVSVLLVQRFPSFEFRFLKHLLERTRQSSNSDRPAFKLTSVLEEGDPQYAAQDLSAELTMPLTAQEYAKFDVVILGDASRSMLSDKSIASLQQFVSEQGGGLLLLAGPNHMPLDYFDSPLNALLPVIQSAPSSSNPEMAFGWSLSSFGKTSLPLQLEADPAANAKRWESLPKQSWRARGLKPKPVAQVLAMSDDASHDPLLLSQFVGAGRIVFQSTDETYVWQSFLGDDLYYQRYWIQLIRWLAESKSSRPQNKVQLTIDKSRYDVGEVVRIESRISNQLLAGRTDQELSVELRRDGQAYRTIQLAQSQDNPTVFTASVDQLEVGAYRAEVSMGSDASLATADFVMQQRPGELSDLGPATKEMKEAADIALGKHFLLADLDQLWASLPPTKPIRLQPLPAIPIWNHWLVLAAVITLLTAEWVIRRSVGLP